MVHDDQVRDCKGCKGVFQMGGEMGGGSLKHLCWDFKVNHVIVGNTFCLRNDIDVWIESVSALTIPLLVLKL